VRPTRPEPPLLEVRDRAELRAWLEANHATSSGVRLAFSKKGGTATSLTYEQAVEEGLAFGWIDSTAGKLDAERETMRFTRRRPGGTWARSNKARVERLIAEGRMTTAGLAVIEAAKADGSWNALDDVESLVIPPDLAAALAADPKAAAGWEANPPSQRKMALWTIVSAKREETRASRVSRVVRAAAEGRPLT